MLNEMKINLSLNMVQDKLNGGTGAAALEAFETELTGKGFSEKDAKNMCRVVLGSIRRDQLEAKGKAGTPEFKKIVAYMAGAAAAL